MNEPATAEKASLNDLLSKRVGRPPAMRTTKISWFPMRDAVTGMSILQTCGENERAAVLSSMRPTLLQLGEVCPFDKASKVAGIFDDEEEVRVYCVSEESLTRYKLSKRAAIFSLDKFEFQGFIDELADEYIQVRDGMSSAEVEREAILQYGAEMAAPVGGQPYSLQEFLEDVKEGVHLSGEEEEEEEEEEEPAQAQIPDAKELPKLVSVQAPAS